MSQHTDNSVGKVNSDSQVNSDSKVTFVVCRLQIGLCRRQTKKIVIIIINRKIYEKFWSRSNVQVVS